MSDIKNHPVWNNLDDLIIQINPIELAKNHLSRCNYIVKGYEDEDRRYYKEVKLPQTTEILLINVKVYKAQDNYCLVCKFSLLYQDGWIGELILIFDRELNFLDENWDLDVDEITHNCEED